MFCGVVGCGGFIWGGRCWLVGRPTHPSTPFFACMHTCVRRTEKPMPLSAWETHFGIASSYRADCRCYVCVCFVFLVSVQGCGRWVCGHTSCRVRHVLYTCTHTKTKHTKTKHTKARHTKSPPHDPIDSLRTSFPPPTVKVRRTISGRSNGSRKAAVRMVCTCVVWYSAYVFFRGVILFLSGWMVVITALLTWGDELCLRWGVGWAETHAPDKSPQPPHPYPPLSQPSSIDSTHSPQ